MILTGGKTEALGDTPVPFLLDTPQIPQWSGIEAEPTP